MNWLPGVTAAVFLGSILFARGADPVTYQELSLRLRMGDTPQALLQEIAQRKLLEPLTREQEAALKNSGAAAEWVAALEAPALLASPEAAAAYRARKQQQQDLAQATPVPAPTPVRTTPGELHRADLIQVGDKAPAFTAKTVEGKDVAVNPPGAPGRLTLLTIVAPQSAACDEELTFFEKQIWPQLAKLGVGIVALGSGQTVDDLAEMGKRLGLHFTLAEDPKKEITALYATNYAPRCYVIGKTGVVKFASVGLNKQDLQRMVNIIESELR